MTTPDRDDLLQRIDALERSCKRWRRTAWVLASAFVLSLVTGGYAGGFYYLSSLEAQERAARERWEEAERQRKTEDEHREAMRKAHELIGLQWLEIAQLRKAEKNPPP